MAVLAKASRLELVYHSIHYVDLVRDLVSPFEPTALHCRTSRHAAMPELSPVRSAIALEFEHDPMLYVNIYTNHHHRWGRNTHNHTFLSRAPVERRKRRSAIIWLMEKIPKANKPIIYK